MRWVKETDMRKGAMGILACLLWTVSTAGAATMQVGAKAPDFKLKDITGKTFSLQTPAWKGKMLLFVAMPVKEAKTNAAVSEAIGQEAKIDRTRLAGAAVFFTPSREALSVLKDRQKETGKTYLIDSDGTVVKLWGLQPGASNVIVLDKARVCRYSGSGKLPKPEISRLMEVIKKYQAQ
jgi:predicted transcriptional regulator